MHVAGRGAHWHHHLASSITGDECRQHTHGFGVHALANETFQAVPAYISMRTPCSTALHKLLLCATLSHQPHKADTR